MDSFKNLERKRIFISGHTGFKGSWLSIWLAKIGAEIYGYSLPPPTNPSNYSISGISGLLANETIGDIRNSGLLEESISSAAPDVIFHLAAQPIVRYGYEHPVETFETNIMGTVNILEAVRKLERPVVVIIVTSDKCYENTGQVWGYRENDTIGGLDPYSASKGASEIVISSYRRSFFNHKNEKDHSVKIASVRAGNVIGGGDWARDRIIPDAVRAVESGDSLSLRNPYAVRPWQHVLEPLSGYLTLAEKMIESGEPELCSGWNFGPYPQDTCSVNELVDQFYQTWGEGTITHINNDNKNTQPEPDFLKLSIDKAIHQLGWQPRWSLATTIQKTAGWYKEYGLNSSESALDLCHKDINEYISTDEYP